MTGELFAFDTNILFYSIDPRDPAKHRVARDLVGRANPDRTRLLLQSLAELYNATSKQRPSMLPEAEVFASRILNLYPTVSTEVGDLSRAAAMQQQHQIQFFDALLLSIAARAGCTLFLSEDMQDNRTYGTITVRNPFTLSPAELTTLIA